MTRLEREIQKMEAEKETACKTAKNFAEGKDFGEVMKDPLYKQICNSLDTINEAIDLLEDQLFS